MTDGQQHLRKLDNIWQNRTAWFSERPTKIQLNELIEYLKSLRDPEYEKNRNEVFHASFGNK
jgi:hypothetical protein